MMIWSKLESRIITRISYLLLVFPAFFMMGCATSPTSKNLVAQFGNTSAKLTETAGPAFLGVREAQRKYILSSALVEKDPQEIGIWATTSPSMDIETVNLRIAVLNELGNYGKALQVIASDKELERIDKASAELSDALGSLNSTIGKIRQKDGPLSGDNLRIVATAVNAIGRWNFERARLEALVAITSTADPLIQETAQVFQCELTDNKTTEQRPECNSIKGRGNWQESLKLALEYDAKNQIILVKKMDVNPKDTTQFQKRESLIQNAIDLNIRKNAVDDEFKNINNALQSLAATHGKIVKALQEDKELPEAIKALSLFSAEVTRLKGFYSSLGTKEGN